MFMRLPAVRTLDHGVHIQRLTRHVGSAREVGVHRHQVVVPVQLHAVARVVEQANALLAAQAFAHGGDRGRHLLARTVANFGDAEAKTLQGGRHGVASLVGLGNAAGPG
jgi:hypothetical protein